MSKLVNALHPGYLLTVACAAWHGETNQGSVCSLRALVTRNRTRPACGLRLVYPEARAAAAVTGLSSGLAPSHHNRFCAVFITSIADFGSDDVSVHTGPIISA